MFRWDIFHCKFPFNRGQRLKFLRNTWDWVKLSHFNKVTFSIKKFIQGVYALQIPFKELFNGFHKGYFWKHLSVVAFDNKLSVYYYRIIFTEPVDYWMKATKISATMIHDWEVSVKHLEEIAVGLVRLKKLSREKFCELWKL